VACRGGNTSDRHTTQHSGRLITGRNTASRRAAAAAQASKGAATWFPARLGSRGGTSRGGPPVRGMTERGLAKLGSLQVVCQLHDTPSTPDVPGPQRSAGNRRVPVR